jgi:hypothetical protein
LGVVVAEPLLFFDALFFLGVVFFLAAEPLLPLLLFDVLFFLGALFFFAAEPLLLLLLLDVLFFFAAEPLLFFFLGALFFFLVGDNDNDDNDEEDEAAEAAEAAEARFFLGVVDFLLFFFLEADAEFFDLGLRDLATMSYLNVAYSVSTGCVLRTR